MARSASAKDVEQEHLQAFGPSLGPIYQALYNEVVWVHAKWQEYVSLYATTPGRINVMNSTAPYLFRMIQDILWDDVMLHIARLLDPAKKNRNLTLHSLPPLITDKGLSTQVRELIVIAETKCSSTREWRNKRLAHSDMTAARDVGTVSLPQVTKQDMDEALVSIAKVIQRLNTHYRNSDLILNRILVQRGDANELVHHLWRAHQFEVRQQQRIASGTLLPEDSDEDSDWASDL